MTKPRPANPGEQRALALWSFLEQLKMQLRNIREGGKALRFCLRLMCEHFQVGDGCIAVLSPDGLRAEVVSVIPRAGEWDLTILAAFLQKQDPPVPRTMIM